MMRRCAFLLLLLAAPRLLVGQSEAAVEALAGVLSAADARRFDEATFRAALANPDSSVRREAAMAVGRLRDSRGVPLLTRLLLDPDSTVQPVAIFALGELGDSAAVPALVQRARDPTPLSGPAALELVSAVTRIGGSQAAAFVRGVLGGTYLGDRADAPYLVRAAALESWRLGDAADVDQLLGLVGDAQEDTRFAAVYSLARLKSRAAAARMIDAMADRNAPQVRAVAAKALTRSYADSAGLGGDVVVDLLLRGINDPDAGVRIQSLRSLGTFQVARASRKVLPLLDDQVPNVQVQAAQTLGQLGGQDAVEPLARIAIAGKGTFARRREALLALATLDSSAFAGAVGGWEGSADWRERAAAAEGWARVDPPRASRFLLDRDPRVVAAALQGWGEQVEGAAPDFVTACRRLLTSRDAAVRSVAADGVARAADPSDIPALIAAYQSAARDSFPEAAISALGALVAIGRTSTDAAATVDREVLARLPPPGDYVIRRWAETNWPRAAQTWGEAYPLDTGRTLQDYRDVARQFLVGLGPERYPKVKMEVDQLGTVELELFGPEAPLTVANFLRLVDRRFFDGLRFHRVVPNFVVQAGDPRGDGWGGPGTAIRDEINRRRYGSFILGMALSGPDTGGSQWFITLSPQPHLDGAYTVFGRVTDGVPVLLRISQGDLIRSIHR